MAGLLVLYIDDKTVGPHLELLRRVCDPHSTSRPHITVRYSRRLGVPSRYFELEVGEVVLTEPGTFDPEKRDPSRRTVFVGCRSDYLKHWEFKPDFKGSEFHITIYNGSSEQFAIKLLRLLRRFKWNLRVPLPQGTRLKEIAFKKSERPTSQPKFSPQAKTLFKKIFGSKLTIKTFENLNERERLRIVALVCKNLKEATKDFERKRKVNTTDWASEPDLILIKKLGLDHIKTGVHITPPELAIEITRYVLEQRNKREGKIQFGDPAVGTGVFYSALLNSVPKHSIGNAIGVDIDPELVLIAHRRWSSEGLVVKLGDYLHMDDLPHRNLILANPPYLRNEDIPSEYKHKLLERASTLTGIKVRGSAGLYVYFLLLSHVWMNPGALAGWLIPATFLDTDYGAAIRYYLTNRVRLIRIHRFGSEDRMFENALVNTAVVVFRNEPPQPKNKVLLTLGGSLDNPVHSSLIESSLLRPEDRWFLRPLSVHVTADDLRLGDFFSIRRGIATGANDFFILSREEARAKGIPDEFLLPILPKVRTLKSSIIEADVDGYPKVDKQLCVINSELSENEIERHYKHFYNYLDSAGPRVRDSYLVRRRHPWYKQEVRRPAPFLCTYMGRASHSEPPVKFIWNKSNAIATNTYLMIYPRPKLAAILKDKPEYAAELFSIMRRIPFETMSDSWRVLAEGLHKIEPKALSDVKLPSVPKWLIKAQELDIFQ